MPIEIRTLLRARGLSLCTVLLVLVNLAGAVLAHTPHDAIQLLEVSPQYKEDQSVFVIVRQNLLKSIDGGRSWKRLIYGLDNRHVLSDLSISHSSEQILFLSSQGDGIYRSMDGGESWRKVNEGLTNLDIVSVSVSPSSPDVVLAVAAGQDLYGTDNGGETWRRLFKGSHAISAVAFSPEDHQDIVIGDDQGFLYVSHDAGASWRQSFRVNRSDAVRAIAISPKYSSDRTILVGTDGSGVLKLVEDEGRTGSFAQVHTRLTDQSIMSIVAGMSPSNETALFVTTWRDGVFRSGDGGDTWTKSADGLTRNQQADTFKKPHFGDVGIATGAEGSWTVFVAGFDGLFRSADDGQTWNQLETLPSNIIVGLAVSPEYANDSTIAISEYFGGAYLSRDKGNTWEPATRDLRGRCDPKYFDRLRLFEIAFSPHYASDRLLFTATWWGFFRAEVDARRWKGTGILHLSKSELALPKFAVSPGFASDQTIYVGTRHGEVLRSNDGGKSFSALADLEHNIPALVISPNFPSDRELFAVWSGGIFKTTDAGQTWQQSDTGVSPDQKAGIKLAISPNYGTDRTIFAGTADGVLVTRDGGANWSKLDGRAFRGTGFVEAIAISPTYSSDQNLIVGIRGKGLFRSVDGGRNFAPIGEELLRNNHSLSATNPFSEQNRTMILSPSYSTDGTIYGFSRDKVLRSEDRGETWTELAVPLPDYGLASFLHCTVAVSGKRKYATALLSGLLAYLLIGYVVFRETNLLRKWPIRLVGGVVASGVVLAVI